MYGPYQTIAIPASSTTTDAGMNSRCPICSASLPSCRNPALSFARLHCAIFTWKKNAPPTQTIAANTCTKTIAS